MKKEDITYSFLRSLAEVQGHLANVHALAHQVRKVYFIGGFINMELMRRFLFEEMSSRNLTRPEVSPTAMSTIIWLASWALIIVLDMALNSWYHGWQLSQPWYLPKVEFNLLRFIHKEIPCLHMKLTSNINSILKFFLLYFCKGKGTFGFCSKFIDSINGIYSKKRRFGFIYFNNF